MTSNDDNTFEDSRTSGDTIFGDGSYDSGTTDEGTSGESTYDESTYDGVGLTGDAPRTLSRPKGPSWGTVALGLICLLVAGAALWVEWTDVNLDWTRSGPLAVVGVGLVLVLVGLAALLRRNDDDLDR
ncbi:MAG: hypothetical protein GX555_07070 [Actinomycetales bacterium]|nr:hypothetical protein [Actinomycetales bacterium]